MSLTSMRKAIFFFIPTPVYKAMVISRRKINKIVGDEYSHQNSYGAVRAEFRNSMMKLIDLCPTWTLGRMGASAIKGVLFTGKVTEMSPTHNNSDAPRLGGLGAPYSNNLVPCKSGDRVGSQCCSCKILSDLKLVVFWPRVEHTVRVRQRVCLCFQIK